MKNKIVVYGGSFNPPLNSHFSIAEHVINEIENVEKVIFLPVNKKYEKDGLEENYHRYNMLKLVVDKNEKFEVSDLDLSGEESMKTIDTLEYMKKQYPDNEIYFLLGSDNLKLLHEWNRVNDLLSNYKILVMPREKDNVDRIIEGSQLLSKYRENIIEIDEEIKSNYSSSYVRRQIRKKHDIRYLMPDEVYFYIKENKLYEE